MTAPVPSGEVETPCATCGGVKHEGGTFHPDTESFLKGLDCPDCGVETPEAAVEAGAVARRTVAALIPRPTQPTAKTKWWYADEILAALIAQGWTPPQPCAACNGTGYWTATRSEVAAGAPPPPAPFNTCAVCEGAGWTPPGTADAK